MYYRKETLSEAIDRIKLEVKKLVDEYHANERYKQAWKDIRLSPWWENYTNYTWFVDL
jgi:hypothetical protein